MDPAEVQELYGGDYARRYDALWPESEMWAAEAAHHVRTLRELITPETRWLDVGCGTGWFLSRFPGVTRAGFDLSPDMLAEARRANPDALFLRQADIRDDIPEWRDAWDLVTCTGQPWSYVDTMAEIGRVARNLASWTAPGGRCFVGLFDLTDFTGLTTPYPRLGEDPWVDTPIITAVHWSVHDAGGVHRDMIAPAVGYWIELFARYFKRIEVLRWPHDPPFLPIARRNLLLSDKREPGDDTATEFIEHPVPPLDGAPAGPADPTTTADVRERGERRNGPPVEPLAPAPAIVTANGDVADAPSGAGVPPAGVRLPGYGWYDQPLSYLVSRVRPWERQFWRSVRRRLGARARRGVRRGR